MNRGLLLHNGSIEFVVNKINALNIILLINDRYMFIEFRYYYQSLEDSSEQRNAV